MKETENFTLVNSVGQNLKSLTKFKLVTFQRPDQWVRALFLLDQQCEHNE